MLGEVSDRPAWKPWLRNYTKRSPRLKYGEIDETSNHLVLFARIVYEDKCDVYTLRDLHDGVQVYQIKADLEILSGIPTKMMEMHFPPNRYLDDEDVLIKGKNVSFGETIRVHLNNSWNDFLQATWKSSLSEVKRFLSLIRKHIGTRLSLGETQSKDYENLLGSALFVASRRGDKEICKILLRNGANAAYTTSLGNSCLHTAASAGHLTVIQLLVMHGANVRCNNIHNSSPMETAINKGHLDCARWLWLNQWSLTINNNFPNHFPQPKKMPKAPPPDLLTSIPAPDSSSTPGVRFRSKTPTLETKKEAKYKSTKSRPHTAHATDYATKIDRHIDDALRKNRYSREHQRDAIPASTPARKNAMFSTSLQSEKTKQIINFFTSRRNRLQSIPTKHTALHIPAENLKGVSLSQISSSVKDERSYTNRSQRVSKSVSSRSSERDSGVSFTHDIQEEGNKFSEELMTQTLKTYELQAEQSNLIRQIPTKNVKFITPLDTTQRINTPTHRTSSTKNSKQHNIQSVPIFPATDFDYKEAQVTERLDSSKFSAFQAPKYSFPKSQSEDAIFKTLDENSKSFSTPPTDFNNEEPEIKHRPPSSKSRINRSQNCSTTTPQSGDNSDTAIEKIDIRNDNKNKGYLTPPPSPTEAFIEENIRKIDLSAKFEIGNEKIVRIPDTNSIPNDERNLLISESDSDHKLHNIENEHSIDSKMHRVESHQINSEQDSAQIKKRTRFSVTFESLSDDKTTVQQQKVDVSKAQNNIVKTPSRTSVKFEPKVPVSDVKSPTESDDIREEKNRKAFEAWLSKKRKSISKQKEEESEIQARIERQKLTHRSSMSITFDEWLHMKEQEQHEVNIHSETPVSRNKPQRRDSKYQKTYEEWKEEKEKQKRSENERKQSEESEKKLKEYYETETKKREYNRKMEAWLKKKEDMKKNEQERKKRVEQMNLEAANFMYQEWLSKPRVKTFEDWKKEKEQDTRLTVVSKAQEQMISEHDKEMEEMRQQIAKEKFEQWLFKKELSKWKNNELELEEVRNRRKKRRSLNNQRIDEEGVCE